MKSDQYSQLVSVVFEFKICKLQPRLENKTYFQVTMFLNLTFQHSLDG